MTGVWVGLLLGGGDSGVVIMFARPHILELRVYRV